MTENKTAKEMFDYRIQLFRDAQAWKTPKRVPVRGNMLYWTYLEDGYTVNQVARDYNIIKKGIANFHKKYPGVDIISDAPIRNAFLVMDSLGKDGMGYSTDSETNLNAITEDVLSTDDYDDIMKDFNKVLYEKALFTRYPKAKDFTPQMMAEAAKTFKDFKEAYVDVLTYQRDVLGYPALLEKPYF